MEAEEWVERWKEGGRENGGLGVLVPVGMTEGMGGAVGMDFTSVALQNIFLRMLCCVRDKLLFFFSFLRPSLSEQWSHGIIQSLQHLVIHTCPNCRSCLAVHVVG